MKKDSKVREIKKQKENIILTNGRIKDLYTSPGLMAASRRNLGVKPSYWLARIIDKMDSIIKPYAKEQQKIIERYTEKDENGKPKQQNNMFIWMKDQEGQANQELNELADIEVDLGIKKIHLDLDALEKKGERFTPEEMLSLLPLITIS